MTDRFVIDRPVRGRRRAGLGALSALAAVVAVMLCACGDGGETTTSAGAGSGGGPTACDAIGDQILDFSHDTRLDIDETAVNESVGVCGAPAVDFNENSVIDGIASAEDYVLVQFYIVKDDGLGRRLKEAMIERARAGVPVYFLFDEVGSYKLPDSYLEDLRAVGVQARADGVGDPRDVEAVQHVEVARGVEGLDVADVLAREILRDRGGDEGEVLVLAQEPVLPHPGLQEVPEVAIAEPLLELL